MMEQNLKKNVISKFFDFFLFLEARSRFEANNNREAVVCARHVVKRPRKRSALVVMKWKIIRMIELNLGDYIFSFFPLQ